MRAIATTLLELSIRLTASLPDLPGLWRLSRLLQNAASRGYLPRNTIVSVKDGFRLDLDTDDFVQRVIYFTRRWEPHVVRTMSSILRAGDVFVDVGANIGYFTILGAKLVGPRGKVLAFEPHPDCRNRLISNLFLNNLANVTVRQEGVAEAKRNAKLYLNATNNSGASSLRKLSNKELAVEIALETLDNVLREERIDRVALIKLDVEGAELLALQGMSSLLSRDDAPAVICEISEWSSRQLGYTEDDIFSFMRGKGYKVRLLSSIGQSGYSDGWRMDFQYDVLFTKAHLPAERRRD